MVTFTRRRTGPIGGQAVTEFVVVLGILTAIGLLLMTVMTNQGQHAQNAIGTAQATTVNAIATDKD